VLTERTQKMMIAKWTAIYAGFVIALAKTAG
jgi:hypothetical protein